MTKQIKTMQSLELDAVLNRLADCAVTSNAKSKCLTLLPNPDIDDVTVLQNETESAKELILLKGPPSFGSAADITGILLRADRGGTLNPSELLKIAGIFKTALALLTYYDQQEFPALNGYFGLLSYNKYLEERISRSILSEEEIADNASPDLYDIRRQIRIQSSKIKESLQKIVSSQYYSKYLRESIVTMRGGRYVVPVKSEYKNEIPGLVHDVSSSGNTFFIEPSGSVSANNALRELEIKEEREIERILSELSAETASHKLQLANDLRGITELDFIFARAKLALKMDAVRPELESTGETLLLKARHPLIDPSKVVPVTLSLGGAFDTLVITGPNTGGKTVTLKTFGLLTLMTECGLQLPAAQGSKVCLCDAVFADIGDEQSIEQSLSTFSSHMVSIVEILEHCDDRSLILFDELGAGTDPAEGAALAVAIIQYCRSIGAKVIATTHYAELKLFALRTEGVMNACCEFNVETLSPTYRLLIGVPGKSNAFAISRKLGLPEEIIKESGALLEQSDKDFEAVIEQLETQRQTMENAREEAEQLRRETAILKEKSEDYYNELKKEREKILSESRREAQRILEEARTVANNSYDEIKKLKKELREQGTAENINERQSKIRRDINLAERSVNESKGSITRSEPTRSPEIGDTVELIKYGTNAVILGINPDGTYQLQAGIIKLNARREDFYLLDVHKVSIKKQTPQTSTREFTNVPCVRELDLRGMASDEAMIVLDQFLDNAVMAHLSQVRIIHGKGTGILRKAVHEELRRLKYVKSFRLGVYGEGEDGVTIAEL